MDRKSVIEKVKWLFYAIVNSLDNVEKQKQDYEMIIPDFSIPNQVGSKRITKQVYITYIHMDIVFLEKFTEYHELIEYLESNCDLNREYLEKLIVELLKRALNSCREKICIKKIEKYINLFYNDIVRNPISYQIKEYVIGISLEDDVYEIDENLSLRKSNSFDFKCRDSGEYNNELQNFSFQFPPVILNYKYLSDKTVDNYIDYSRPPELTKELLLIDWAILSFRSAPIFRIKTKSKIESLFRRSITIIGSVLPIRTVEKYEINKNNIKD